MKKALHRAKKAFLYEKQGKIYPEEVCTDEIVAAVNRGISREWPDTSPETIVLRKLHDWISRFIKEGATDAFCNDLNTQLKHVQYSNYIVPPDFYGPGESAPQSVYIADMNIDYSPETFAAKEVSRFITYGILDRVRRCQLSGCEKIFLGPPQAKWCSKTCGSKHRVAKKRKKEAR